MLVWFRKRTRSGEAQPGPATAPRPAGTPPYMASSAEGEARPVGRESRSDGAAAAAAAMAAAAGGAMLIGAELLKTDPAAAVGGTEDGAKPAETGEAGGEADGTFEEGQADHDSGAAEGGSDGGDGGDGGGDGGD